MGRIEDLGYNPNDIIKKPEREGIGYLDTGFNKSAEDTKSKVEELLNGNVDNTLDGSLNDADISNPFDTMKIVFQRHIINAESLIEKSTFLMDTTIKDIDSYVGDASPIILEYISDLTGVNFKTKATAGAGSTGSNISGTEVSKPLTDPAFTLTEEEMKCIFEAAGYYDPNADSKQIIDALQNGDSETLKAYVKNKIESMSYFKSVFYGLKLLIVVIKLCHVIMIHYQVGYFCAIFKDKLNIGWKKKIAGKKIGFTFGLGNMISKIFKRTEIALLAVVGYRCNQEGKLPTPCDTRAWDKIQPNVVTCCTTSPVFFNDVDSGDGRYNMTDCTKAWVGMQLDGNAGAFSKRGPICSGNCSKERRRNSSIVPHVNKYSYNIDNDSDSSQTGDDESEGVDTLYEKNTSSDIPDDIKKELETTRVTFTKQLDEINSKIYANIAITAEEQAQRNALILEIDDINEALGLTAAKEKTDIIIEEEDNNNPTDTTCSVTPEEREKAKTVADYFKYRSFRS